MLDSAVPLLCLDRIQYRKHNPHEDLAEVSQLLPRPFSTHGDLYNLVDDLYNLLMAGRG